MFLEKRALALSWYRAYQMAVAFRMADAKKQTWETWERKILDGLKGPEELQARGEGDWDKLKALAKKQGRKKKG